MNSWVLPIGAFIVITVLVFFLVSMFLHVWQRESRIRNLVINLSLSIFSILYLLLIVEIVFAMVFVQSDGGNNTLVSKRWFQKYWNPINSYGYRDYEPKWKEDVLFVVGDSFIAGHGIKNIDDRLANILARKLENRWTTTILAKNGWNSVDEYAALVNHPKKPDRIILSYFLNDIQSAARKHGFQWGARPGENPPGVIKPLVYHSYLFNWLYMNFIKLRHRQKPGGSNQLYFRTYNDEKIWAAHKEELQNIINYANEIGSEIAFVVWPSLGNVDGSLGFTTKVASFLEKQQVEVINLSEHFAGRKRETLTVSQWDGHPNIEINVEVAELIYKTLSPWD